MAMAECYYCGKQVSDQEAVDSGWAPDFWKKDGEYVNSGVCTDCYATRLTIAKDGEYSVKDLEPEDNDPIQTIAAKFFQFSLKTRGSDSLDFHEVAVWQIEKALIAAYQAGKASR
jgi:hypothetical protein